MTWVKWFGQKSAEVWQSKGGRSKNTTLQVMHFLNSPLLVKVSTSYHIYNFRNWRVINYTHSLLPIYTYVKGCIGVILILKCFLGNLLAMDKLHQILTKHSRVMKQIFQKGDTLPFHLPPKTVQRVNITLSCGYSVTVCNFELLPGD